MIKKSELVERIKQLEAEKKTMFDQMDAEKQKEWGKKIGAATRCFHKKNERGVWKPCLQNQL